MRHPFRVYLFLLFFTFIVLASPNKPVILPCRPINTGSEKSNQKNLWLTALIDRQVRFRLSPSGVVESVDEDIILNKIPSLYNYSENLTNDTFYKAAADLSVTHLLIQKFELLQNDKMVNYYADLVEKDSQRSIAYVEKDIPLDQISLGIDSSLIILLPQAGIELSNDAIRFLTLPVAGTSSRSMKALGEQFCKESDVNYNRKESGEEYEKLLKKDPFMLLASYSAGMIYFSIGNYEKSAKYIKDILDITPVYASLNLVLARSYRMQEKYNEALSIALSCERNRLKTAPYMLEKALALEGLKQDNAAASVHRQILVLEPEHPVSLLYMANLKNNERSYSEGGRYAQKLLRTNKTNDKAYLELGRSLNGIGKYIEAKKALISAEKLQPKNPLTQELLGDILMIENKPDSAYLHYSLATTIRPIELDLFLKSSKALEASGKNKEALELLYTIANRFPSQPVLFRQIGMLEYANDRYDSTVKTLSKYIEGHTDDGHALQIIGNSFMKLKNYSKAKEYLLKALPIVSNKTDCKLLLAEVDVYFKEHVAAITLLNEIIAEKPVKHAHEMLGDAILLSGKKQDALKEFRTERELHGVSVPLQEKIALLYYQLGFSAPAKIELEQLAKIDPTNAGAFYHLAILDLQSGNIPSGEAYFNKAQKLGPGTTELFYLTGNLFSKHRHFDKAIDAYNKCIVLDPKHENALGELSDAYLSAEKDTAAASVNIRLFRLNPNRYSARLAQAGHLYLKHHDEKAAEQAYRVFIEKGFSDFSVNTNYAGIAFRKKDYPLVISLLKNMTGEYAANEDNLLFLSDAYCKTTQHAKALPWLEKLRRITISNPIEARLSAQANEITGDTITAIAMYVRLLSFPPDSLHANEAYHLGTLYEKKNLIENAIVRYEQNTKETPDDLRSHERLGKIYLQRSDWENALRILETALSFSPVPPEITKMLARTYSATGNTSGAIEMYTAYLSKVTNDAIVWKELADIYYNQKKYHDAIKPFEQITKLQPDNFEAWYKLGYSIAAHDDFATAAAAVGRARALKPNNLQAIELSARCYRHLNETSTLKSILREWITLDPRRYDIKMELSLILINGKEIDEAMVMLADAIRFIPSEPKPHLLMAKAYELKANDSLRFKHLSTALKFGPENWETHYELARYCLSIKLGHDAERHFKKALALFPANGMIHYEYGLFLTERNEFEAAKAEFIHAHEIEPDNGLFLSLRAFTESITGNTELGLQMCTKALKNNLNDPRILYWSGRSFKIAGRIQDALTAYSDALAIDSSCAECLEALGDITMEEVKFKEAATLYFQAWDKGGYNPVRVYKLGNALFYDFKFSEARDFFETILAKEYKFDDARYRLVAAYCELGELDKARKQLPLFSGNGSHWIHLSKGCIYEHENNSQSALASYTTAKKASPDHPDIAAGLGRIFMQKQHYDSAIIYLSTASAADTLNMKAMIDLGSIFEAMGNQSSAIQYYLEVDKKYPAYPGVQLRIASIKSRQKAHELAIRHLLRGIEFHPNDTGLYFMLGQEYIYTSQYTDAVEALKKALKAGKGKPIEALRLLGNIYYDYLTDSRKAKEYYKKYVKAGGEQKDALERLAEG